MKRALLIAAVDPGIGGVLVFGDRGTGKSTAVRALARLLPKRRAVAGCRFACDADDTGALCPDCAALTARERRVANVPIPVVDLPLGATEDRLVGALDIERALTRGEKPSNPACSRPPTAASSTSTRSISWRITSSTSCSTSPPPARTWWSARACRCAIPRASC